MDEKIIIKSQQYKVDVLSKLLIVIGLAGFIFSFFYNLSELERYMKVGAAAYPDDFLILAIPSLALAILSFLIKPWLSSYEMVVTDKRIYGRVAFGKRVDLPFDSISATAILRMLKGVAVSTASGRIKFLLIKNANEIYNEINKLLIERQKKETPANKTAETKIDTTNDLIKLKELLDMGVITQEDFDAKKKQILGL